MKEISVTITKYQSDNDPNKIFDDKDECQYFDDTFEEKRFKPEINRFKKINDNNWKHFKYEALMHYIIARKYGVGGYYDYPLHRRFFTDIDSKEKIIEFIKFCIKQSSHGDISKCVSYKGTTFLEEYQEARKFEDKNNIDRLHPFFIRTSVQITEVGGLRSIGFATIKQFGYPEQRISDVDYNKESFQIEGYTVNYLDSDAKFTRGYGTCFYQSKKTLIDFLRFLNKTNILKEKEYVDILKQQAERLKDEKALEYLNKIESKS